MSYDGGMEDETRDGGAPEAAEAPSTATSDNARMWAVAAHLSAFTMFIGIPPVIGPLIVWLVKRNDDPYIDFHGKEAVNFNISFLIYMLVSGLLILVVVGIVLLPIAGLVWLVLVIVAAVKTSDGEHYRYPLTIRFIS